MSRVRQVRCLGVEFKEVLIPKPKADVALACLTLVPLLHLTGPQSSHLYSGDNTNLTSQGCSFINFSKKKKKIMVHLHVLSSLPGLSWRYGQERNGSYSLVGETHTKHTIYK
jgi:hypothetical protein